MQVISCGHCGVTNRVRSHPPNELPICGRCGSRIGTAAIGAQRKIQSWLAKWRRLGKREQASVFDAGSSNPNLNASEQAGCKAQSLWMSGDLDGALAAFNDAVRLAPNDATLLLNRGNLNYERGDFDAALVDFQTSLAGSPALPWECYAIYHMLKDMSPETKQRLMKRRKSNQC